MTFLFQKGGNWIEFIRAVSRFAKAAGGARLPMLIFLLVIAACFARAQSPAPPVRILRQGGPEIVLPPGVELPPGIRLPGAVSQESRTNAANNAQSPEEKRLEELLKLSFDRGPATILSTLSERFDGSSNTNEVKQFEGNVIAGDWDAVGEFLSGLPEDHGEQVYRHLIKELSDATTARGPGSPPRPGMVVMSNPNQQGPANQAAPSLVLDDILALAEIAPHDLNDEDARQLGALLGNLLSRGDALDPLLPKLEKGVKRLGGTDPEDRSRAAELLLAAIRLTEAAQFLIPIETAREKLDWRALDEHARDLEARGQGEKDSQLLKEAWELNQFILMSKDAAPTNREPAVKRCLELMPLLAREAGTNWLRESFRSDPGRGLAILGAVNDTVQSALGSRSTDQRRKNLELQKEAVDSFLEVADPQQPHWRIALNLLAQTWMQEGTWTRERFQQRRNAGNPIFDQYGNIIAYQNYPQPPQFGGNQIPPIEPEEIVSSAPDDHWLAFLDESLRLGLVKLIAELHMKTDTPEKALPYIETLVETQRDDAGDLANSLLRAWAESHDPMQRQQQSQQRMISSGGVIYYSGGSPSSRPPGISLTRAMQVRNIEELASMIHKLKAMDLPELDKDALATAFAQAHSPAEVFQKTDIESVFGPVETMKPEILATLAQAMRERLAQQWRSPRTQQQMKTERTDKQIDAEVLGGYETVLGLIDVGLRRDPDNWNLNLVRSITSFDLAEFQYGQKVDLEIYVEKRDEAFDGFERAASLYAAHLSDIPEKEQSPEVYRQWFNANLGASDLAFVTRQQEPETNQLARIRNAILALPGDAPERHMSAFAKSLGQGARMIRGELKPRYMRAGLLIVGDHPDGKEARELVTYYDDLLREIEFVVRLDGDEIVGHDSPFGVFVSLRHTADIEREAGGFARYLRDTKKSSSIYYPSPYGQQPQRNFIEDFDRQVREKLIDQFEVLSITFLDEKTKSRGYGREGWRETPLAYLMLQAKDGAVDQLPAFQMDLDFFDSSGPVVLPIRSQITPLDARPERVEARPVNELAVTQILDDRDLAEGLLTLEIKARGKGIVPGLRELLHTNFTDFDVLEVNDPEVTMDRIETEGGEVAAITERNWLFKLKLKNDSPASVTFHFPSTTGEATKSIYKRYVDADLVEVEPEVALAGLPLRPRPLWHWLLLGALILGIAGLIGRWWRQHKPEAEGALPTYALPEQATPFSLIDLLRRMQRDKSLPWPDSTRAELAQTIDSLERRFFARQSNGNSEPDLRALGMRWVNLAENGKPIPQPVKSNPDPRED